MARNFFNMPSDKDLKCRADLIGETPAAINVKKLNSVFTWWIPRSQIGYMRIDKSLAKDGTMGYVEFTLPEWLVEKKQCWDLVE